MLDYIKYLKNREVLQEPSILLMLLTQFLKKIIRTEGLGNFKDEEDDLYRPYNKESRLLISTIVKQRPEIGNGVRVLFD